MMPPRLECSRFHRAQLYVDGVKDLLEYQIWICKSLPIEHHNILQILSYKGMCFDRNPRETFQVFRSKVSEGSCQRQYICKTCAGMFKDAGKITNWQSILVSYVLKCLIPCLNYSRLPYCRVIISIQGLKFHARGPATKTPLAEGLNRRVPMCLSSLVILYRVTYLDYARR